MRFRDSVIWITGASSGIGEALCQKFCNEGAHIVLSARRVEELQRVAKTCNGPGEILVQPSGENDIIVEAPGESDPERRRVDS